MIRAKNRATEVVRRQYIQRNVLRLYVYCLWFEFQEVNGVTGISLDAVPPYTPEVTWSPGNSVRLQYRLNTAFGTITPRLDASYQDNVFTEPANTEFGRIDSCPHLPYSMLIYKEIFPESPGSYPKVQIVFCLCSDSI